MWLSSISNRTPKAYFLYFLFGICLLLIPLLGQFNDPSNWSPFRLESLSFLVPALLILLLSFLCNRIYVLADIYPRNTLWPGHTFLIMSIAVGLNAAWMGIVIHGLAGILIMNELLHVHYNRDARLPAFNVAFCIGIASFFESSTILIAPFLLLGLRNLKPLNFKEYIIFLLGVGAPYYFLWAYAYLTNDYSHWHGIFPIASWFNWATPTGWLSLLVWLVPLIGSMAALVFVFASFNSLSVRNKRLSVAALYLLIGTVMAAFAAGGQSVIIFYITPPFGFLATLLMLRYSNKRLLEIIHIIFVGIIIGALLVSKI